MTCVTLAGSHEAAPVSSSSHRISTRSNTSYVVFSEGWLKKEGGFLSPARGEALGEPGVLREFAMASCVLVEVSIMLRIQLKKGELEKAKSLQQTPSHY